MIILNKDLEVNTFSIVPRLYTNDDCLVKFRDELRDTIIEFTQTPTLLSDLMYFELNLVLKNGQSFEVEIKDGQTIIYKGKAIVQ